MIKRISNGENQNADNLMKRHVQSGGCCGESANECEYSLTYTQSNAVNTLNITEDGATRALTCAPATTSAADVRAGILASLEAAGYEDWGEPNGVTVVDNGSTLTVTIVSDVPMVSLVHAGGTATFTAKCNKVGLCNYVIAAYTGGASGAAATNLVINGVTYNLGTITPGTTSAANVKTAVEGAITSAALQHTTVTVTANGSTSYDITINALPDVNFILGGTWLTRGDCVQDYVA